MNLEPKQLVVMKFLSQFLSGITVANGYNHDLSESVFRGRTLFGESDPTPMLSILEMPKQDEGPAAGADKLTRKDPWMLMVQGWGKDDKANPSDPAYLLKADVEQRLAMLVEMDSEGRGKYDVYRMKGLIADLSIGQGVVRPPDQVSTLTYFYLPVRVSIVVKAGDPFVDSDVYLAGL